MNLKNLIFSYVNILSNELNKKKFFSFLRKIFNFNYKLFLNLIRKCLSRNYINLDKIEVEELYDYSLDELFLYFNCDKGSSFKVEKGKKIISHNYSLFYEKFFKKLKNEKMRLLEIGSHEGKGLAAFYFFLPNTKFLGANINPFQMRYSSKRIEEVYIDVSSKKIVENFESHFTEEFDIIIDDASHNLRDILITLPIMFRKLKKGGYYVIEDINQFDVFKNLNPTSEVLTPLMILKNMSENKRFHSNFISEADINYLKENIKNYFFEKGDMVIEGNNISDIVFLKKND